MAGCSGGGGDSGTTRPATPPDRLAVALRGGAYVAFRIDLDCAVADRDGCREIIDALRRSAEDETCVPAGDDGLLSRLLQANKGFRTFADIVAKSQVLFAADDAYAYDARAVQKVLARGEGAGYAMLAELRPALAGCDWTAEALDKLIERICRERQVGMGKVAQPIRVAVTGTTISPGIVETLMLLGRQKALARIDRCLARRDAAEA